MKDYMKYIHQAEVDPIESLESLTKFLSALEPLPESRKVGVLTDENGKNEIVFVFTESITISLRLNLSEEQEKQAFSNLTLNKGIELRYLQGKNLVRDDLNSIKSLISVWGYCVNQSNKLTFEELKDFRSKLVANRKEKGRGAEFTKPTLDQVARDSHGRCMFEGCGENLLVDDLTGYKGNYSYNAHNVASSVSGPRGIPYLSATLSNTSSNILLLCDKHHRLIDKIATVDFNASRLSEMRSDFTKTVNKLLEGLSFQPIPVFSILWPIGGHVLSEPDERDIANCLSRIKARIVGGLNMLSTNERSYRKKPESFLRDMDEIVESEANSILQQTLRTSHRAALFAFGPMSALVGLGACLGNKCEITPMLRYRDGSCWIWPQELKVEKPYDIKLNADELAETDEVILCIGMTNYTESMKLQAEQLNLPIIEVLAKNMGNAAIPHPDNGHELRSDLHLLLQSLYDKHKIKKVHLLICASNAVCIFIGQAFDLYQPDLLVYDFAGDSMELRLKITTKKGITTLSPPYSD